MCGILGLVGSESEETTQRVMREMGDAIVHRGPDDAGYWAEPGFGFGMRRLSIIDVENGSQPMWVNSELGIVFNGEIYNYKEIRESLKSDGYHFTTRSDTEVLLKVLHRDGLGGLKLLNGMFAIALIDRRSKKLSIVRDRMGIKPLYYGQREGRFAFCSEIKGLLKAFENKPKLDFQSIHHYLTFRYVPSPDTMWEGIHKLEPGHILTFDLREQVFQVSQYWELSFNNKSEDSQGDYLKDFTVRFEGAVRRRLEASDVPVGVMLSGGLDSSAIAATAVRLGKNHFHTFNVAFEEGGEYSEAEFAKEVSRHLGTVHHQVNISKRQFVDFLPTYASISDEPLADLSSIPLCFVSRLAQKHVKVVLSGEGSDEVLAGYNFDQINRKLTVLNRLINLTHGRDLGLLGKSLPNLIGKNNNQYSIQRLLSPHMTKVFSEREKSKLWIEQGAYRSSIAKIRDWYDEVLSPDLLDQMLQVYCRSWLVDDLLMKADKMSMANSIELRVPFLDHTFVEWAQTIPNSWKIGGGDIKHSTKRILREYARGLLPQQIIDRPKRGFPVPAYHWMQNDAEIRQLAADKLIGPKSMLSDLFELEETRKVFQASKTDSRAVSKVWSLYILEEWLRKWS